MSIDLNVKQWRTASMLNGIHLGGIQTLVVLGLLFLTHSAAHAGGIPDGPNVQITDAGLGDDRAFLPRLAVSGESVYATWADDRPTASDTAFGSVFFAKSTDGGKSWGGNVLISSQSFDEWIETPKIAVFPNGTIVIIWQTYRRWTDEYPGAVDSINDVRMALSTDDGESFTRYTILDGYDQDGDFHDPSLAVDPTTGHTYFLVHDYRASTNSDDEGYEMKFSRFDVATTTFTIQPKSVNDVAFSGRGNDDNSFGLGRDDHPHIDLAARDGIVCAAWEDRRERTSIFGTCSQDGGENFSANFNISGADGIEPQIALAPDGSLYAIYAHDSDGDRNIRLRRSSDLGVTWEEEQVVTNNIEVTEIQNWDLEVDDNNQIVIAWADDHGARGDVILSTSLDQGLNFSHQRVDDDPDQNADTFNVTLAVGGTGTETRAYVAWRDDRIDFDDKIWSQPVILDGVGPTVPGNVQTVGEDNAILLTWAASTDATGIAGYRVYRSSAETGPFVEIAPRGAYEPFYRDVELMNGETYFYQIAAVDGTGNTGVRSEPLSAAAQVGTGLPVVGTIAFSDGNNVKLLDLPALDNPRTLTQGLTPYISPGGERVFYYSNGAISSKLVAGGGDQVHFQSADITNAYDITGDGAKIGAIVPKNFPTADGTLCFVTEPTYYDLALPRYTDSYNRSFDIAISSTGQWLAYDYTGYCNITSFGITSPPSFCLLNTSTSEKNCIPSANFATPDFASSGSRIVFAAKESGERGIWTADVQDNGSLANYIQITRDADNQPSSEPAFSSNGEWIIFQRDMDTSENERFELYVVKSDGSALRPLNLEGRYPAWHNGAIGAVPNPNPNPAPEPTGNQNPIPANLAPAVYMPVVQ